MKMTRGGCDAVANLDAVANHANRTDERTLLQVPFRAFLFDLFGTAIAAAHPDNCLAAHLPAPLAAGRLVILAAGKAAGAMAEVAERYYVDQWRDGGRTIERSCGHTAWLWAPHPIRAAHRGRPSGSRRRRACSHVRNARAGRQRRSRRSGLGAHLWRRIRQLDRARLGALPQRQADADPRPARLRRLDLRDQHGAQASVAHQGWSAGGARRAGSAGRGRHFRRARQRSIGDRLRPDRT